MIRDVHPGSATLANIINENNHFSQFNCFWQERIDFTYHRDYNKYCSFAEGCISIKITIWGITSFYLQKIKDCHLLSLSEK
jgi:hypothetical protein